MSWNEILETTVEIINLQSILDKKGKDPIIKGIVNRNDKYCDKEIDLRSLNNALLEHQVMITPYQISILAKINELSLHTDTNLIYTNMPGSIEEASKYILDLKEKYELAIKSFDLVMDIEKLSAIEYDGPFENNEYTRKIQKETEFLINMPIIEFVMFEKIVNQMEIDFYNSLTKDEKKNLLLQTFCFSYDRNTFNHFEVINNVPKLQNGKSCLENRAVFWHYRKYIELSQQSLFIKMPLSKIYDEFKLIYETDLLKEKMKKKSV